jgi:predicted transcriptional regulator
MLPDDTHEKMVAKMLENPVVRAEYERIEREEMPMFDAILAARKEAGLTQAQVAERMGTKAPAIARLENALITGSPSPSLATLRKYAAALGKRLEVRLT